MCRSAEAQFFFGRFFEKVSVKSNPRDAVRRPTCVEKRWEKSLPKGDSFRYLTLQSKTKKMLLNGLGDFIGAGFFIE